MHSRAYDESGAVIIKLKHQVVVLIMNKQEEEGQNAKVTGSVRVQLVVKSGQSEVTIAPRSNNSFRLI